MQKAHSPSTEGALQIKPIGLILPQSLKDSNRANKCQIFDLIEQRRLTDSIEWFEQYNISTKKALACIARIQRSGGAS